MTSETRIQDAAGFDTSNAQIIGLAAIIANLPGVKDVQAHAVDAAIEGMCHDLGKQVRGAASEFAHDILQAARSHFTPGGQSSTRGVTAHRGHRGG